MKPILVIHTAKVVSGMNKMKAKTPHASKMAMLRAVEMLGGYIVKNKLSGQVLKRRTGHLAGSISTEVLGTRYETIGRIGSNLKYARVHELGIDKMVSIRAHTRKIKMAFGNIISPREIHISAHSRHMKQKKRRYIENSMREYRSELQMILGRKFWTEVTSE